MHLNTRKQWSPSVPSHKDIPVKIKMTTFNLPQKLWPTSYHTALVWGALVRLATPSGLKHLYSRLLRWSRSSVQHAGDGVLPTDLDADDASIVLGAAPVQAFDAAHYLWFFDPYPGAG